MNSKLVSGLKWVFLEQSSSQIISFLVLLFLARLLGPESFGLLALSYLFISLIVDLIQQSFAQAIVHRKELEPEHLQAAFWANVGLSIGTGLIFLGFSEQIASLLNEPELADILKALTLILLVTPVLVVQQAIFKRELNFQPMATRLVVATLIGNGVAIAMALYGFGVWSLVAREIVTHSINALLLMQVSEWRPKLSYSHRHFKELFSYGTHVILGNFATFVSLRADIFFIGYFLGTASLGYYNIALRLVSTLNNFLGRSIEKVAMPTFARLQKDTAALKSAFSAAMTGTGFLILPIMSGLFLCIEELSPLLFGEKWNTSIPIMQAMLVLGIVQNLCYVKIALLMGIGRPGERTLIVGIEGLLKIGAIVLAYPHGLLAVAIGVTAASYLVLPLWLRPLKKHLEYPAHSYLSSLALPFGLTAAMILAVLGVQRELLSEASHPMLSVAATAITGIVVYGLGALLLKQRLSKIMSVLKD